MKKIKPHEADPDWVTEKYYKPTIKVVHTTDIRLSPPTRIAYMTEQELPY